MSFQQVDFAQYWNTLQETVKNILSLNTVTMEAWNKSFNDVFILSISYPSSNSKKLYESTKLLLEEHVLELLHIVQTENGWNLLQMYYMYWQQYSQCIKHLNSLYRYFNTHNMQRHGWNGNELMYRNIGLTDTIYMEIKELGLDVWKCNMILPLKDSISKLILVEIDKKKHRISKTTSLNTITGVINSFIEVQKSGRNQLELYQSYLEQPFLEQSKKHIKLEAARLLQEFTVSEYLVKVLQYMKDEDFRSKRYLPDSTYNTIQLMCYQHFVIDHFNLIREDSVAIIKEEQFYDMRNIYVLLNKANYGLNEIADIFRQHLEQDGMTVIESLKQKQVYLHFIEALIDFHKKNESIVLDVFNNNILFIEALNKAFTTIVNYQIVENQRSKSPEYLSNYCDMLLKKSYKSINELAIRLMLQQSQSTDVEKRMIIKLQEVNGYKFTSNLHKMLIDIRVSKGLNAQFHNEFLEAASDKLNVSFSTYVLRSDVWPLNSSTTSFVLPKQLISCTQHFEVFYKEKFNGKTLTWIHHMSRGMVTYFVKSL
ncbi:cullin-2-like [Melanaphis sacchari]|uniref:cullin-2-like n=1 Tax=Melanaphis sacchari TaxID=742174 RepID=UPI000DC132EA|nr:cullin-2-like [Melanaphis sacchari]